MRRSVIAAALVAALTLAACGSTNTSDSGPTTTGGVLTVTAPASTPTVPAPSAITTTATVTTTPTTPTTVTTATITRPDSGGAGLTTATTASAPACVAADLTPTPAPPNGATGTVVLGFTLKNTGSGPCSTFGWPGVAFVNAAGSAVPTQTTRTTHDILGSTPVTRFTIAAGDEASFRVTVHDSNDQGGESGCGSYGTVQIIAPNDTATMQVKLPNGPAEVCGAAAISPVEPGTSATGQ
jgi:hypothetical protein